MKPLLDDQSLAQRILDHIDNKTTDLGDRSWREPVANYRSRERFELEMERVLRRTPTPFCPSAALAEAGSFVARDAAGVPLLAVRGADGVARVFRNACRHRGAQVACGAGRAQAFVCPYHAWAYGLDGSLRNIPHEYGFPGVDKATHGLVPVQAEERAGIVFVTQDTTGPKIELDEVPQVFGPDLKLVSTIENKIAANWKVFAESFIEGYHIYSTHRDTFFPVQFDNLNVVEHFGRNSRVTYPYRNVEKLRTIAPGERRLGGTVTHVYHMFPNVMISTFPKRVLLTVLEPTSVETTTLTTYTLAEAALLADETPAIERAADFVNQGAKEDREVVESIQRGLASGANDAFEFGRFEAAIVHFHHNLQTLIGTLA